MYIFVNVLYNKFIITFDAGVYGRFMLCSAGLGMCFFYRSSKQQQQLTVLIKGNKQSHLGACAVRKPHCLVLNLFQSFECLNDAEFISIISIQVMAALYKSDDSLTLQARAQARGGGGSVLVLAR